MPTQAMYDSSLSYESIDNDQTAAGALDASELPWIKFGKHLYRLRQTRRSVITPTSYSISGLEDSIVGRGDNVPAAQLSFQAAFHRVFQRLQGLRSFDLSGDDRRIWNTLVQLVDLKDYYANLMVTETRIGSIRRDRTPWARTVHWLGGGGRQEISMADAPAEFAALSVGQYFEAAVEVEYNTRQFRSLESVRAIKTPEFAPSARKAFWHGTDEGRE